MLARHAAKGGKVEARLTGFDAMQVRPNYVVRLVGHKAGHRVSSVSLDRLAQQSRHHLQSIELISRICLFYCVFSIAYFQPFSSKLCQMRFPCGRSAGFG